MARVELGATFEEVATAWFRRAGGERPWKPATERGYRSMLWGGNPQVMNAFGSWRLHEITRRDVRAWWSELISPRREPRALSARDANGHLALLRTILNWADCTDEYGPIADPSKGIPKCAEPAIGKADFFEVEEVYALARGRGAAPGVRGGPGAPRARGGVAPRRGDHPRRRVHRPAPRRDRQPALARDRLRRQLRARLRERQRGNRLDAEEPP